MARITYQYRLYPSKAQVEQLNRWLRLCCNLYNAALEQRILARSRRIKLGYIDQQNQLPALRAENPDFAEVSNAVEQNVLLRLDRAYDNFFRRVKQGREKAGFPRFRSRHRYDSLTYPAPYKFIKGEDFQFPKIGTIRMVMHRPLPAGSVMKTATVIRKADGWYASISMEVPDVAAPVHHGPAVGVDVGITTFAALSTGERITAPDWFRAAERRLARAQRVLARRVKGSRRRERQKQRVRRIHLHVSRQREDFHRKTALDLAERFSLVCIENLNIKGMVQNHHLAKSIADRSWGMFSQKLEHAAAKTGARVISVNPRGTSQACSGCGSIVNKTLATRVHKCPDCGLELDRDVNAARNILKTGVRSDRPEFTLGETRTTAFRYRRKVSPVAEPRTQLMGGATAGVGQ